MNLKRFFCFLAFGFYSLKAQQNTKDLTHNQVSKGTFFVGVNTDLSFGFAYPERNFLRPTHFQPKIGYFILNRLSLELAYQGTGLSYPRAPYYLSYHRGSLDLNYYFYTRKNILLYTQTGLSFEQYSFRSFYNRRNTTLNLKLGAGISWRLKKNPNIGLNLEAAYYLGPKPGPHMQVQKFPDLTFGVSYFFHRKKSQPKTLLQP